MITLIIILGIIGFFGYRYVNGRQSTSSVAKANPPASNEVPERDSNMYTTNPPVSDSGDTGKLALAICAAPFIIVLQMVLTMFGYAFKSHFLCNRAADLGDFRRSLFH